MKRSLRVPAVYSPDYCVPTRSRTLQKMGAVSEVLRQRGLFELVDPGYLDIAQLLGLHDPRYVRAFLEGKMPLAISQNLPWSPELRTAVLSMLAGQLTGARLALRHGVAGNVASGFHHAHYKRGGGFCTFNGLALVARALPGRRVFVLDCDQHGGNGTEDFAARLPNLFSYSIFGAPFGCRGGTRSVAHWLDHGDGGFAGYGDALRAAFLRMREWRADFVVYQAGTDCHIDDPLGRGPATTEDLMARDATVFRFCREQRLPVLFTLAGGYQTMESAAALHGNTFEMAAETFGRKRSLESA